MNGQILKTLCVDYENRLQNEFKYLECLRANNPNEAVYFEKCSKQLEVARSTLFMHSDVFVGVPSQKRS